MEKIIVILKEIIRVFEFIDGYLSKVGNIFSSKQDIQGNNISNVVQQVPTVANVDNNKYVPGSLIDGGFFRKGKEALQHIIKVITTIPEVLAEGQNTIAQSRLKEAYDQLKDSANKL